MCVMDREGVGAAGFLRGTFLEFKELLRRRLIFFHISATLQGSHAFLFKKIVHKFNKNQTHETYQ